MPGIDKARVRVLVVIVLLIVAAAALHGYLPGGQGPARVRSTSSLGSLFAVVALLTVSMVIIAIVVITQPRLPSVSPGRGEPPREISGERRSLTWRMALIAVGVVIAWLLLAVLPSRPNMQLGVEQDLVSLNVLWLFAGGAGLIIIVMSVGSMIARDRRQRRAKPAQVGSGDEYRPSARTGPESRARAAELGLAELGDLSREPGDAIVAGYLAMEGALEDAPRGLQAHNAIRLVELFEEARFSPHVMTEGHRDDAVRALRQVLSEMQASS